MFLTSPLCVTLHELITLNLNRGWILLQGTVCWREITWIVSHVHHEMKDCWSEEWWGFHVDLSLLILPQAKAAVKHSSLSVLSLTVSLNMHHKELIFHISAWKVAGFLILNTTSITKIERYSCIRVFIPLLLMYIQTTCMEDYDRNWYACKHQIKISWKPGSCRLQIKSSCVV